MWKDRCITYWWKYVVLRHVVIVVYYTKDYSSSWSSSLVGRTSPSNLFFRLGADTKISTTIDEEYERKVADEQRTLPVHHGYPNANYHATTYY